MKKVLFLFLLVFAFASPVFSQDTDGDGVADSLDLDNDNDGILDTDEGTSDSLGTWGLIDPTVANGTVDNGLCSNPGGQINYTVTDSAAGGSADGTIYLSRSGYEHGGYPTVAKDTDFEITFSTPVNIRIASRVGVFGVVPLFPNAYYNTSLDDINIVTDGTGYNFVNGVGVSGFIPSGTASGRVDFNVAVGNFGSHPNDQTWYIDIYDVTSFYMELDPGTETSQFAIAVSPAFTCLDADTDNDGTPNHLDWDSDDDGCPDAVEGGGTFTPSDLINYVLCDNGACVDVDGVPTNVGSPQSVGGSQDENTLGADCGPTAIETEEATADNLIISTTNNSIQISGTGEATIYNLTGQRVYQAILTGNTSVKLNKGIYLVRLTSEGTTTTKKVYLN